MADVAASYGFEVTAVPEGHRVTYQRLPLPAKVYVLSAILGVIMIVVTALSFVLPWPCGMIVFVLFLVIVPIRLWILYRRRVASPTTFLVTPSHLVVDDDRYERAHIARFFIHDPMSEGDVVYTQGQSGGFYVGGTGAAGVGMAAGMGALNSASQGTRQILQQVGEGAANSAKAVSVSIKFAYGEKTHTLATGLNTARARLLLDAIVTLINPPAPGTI